MRLHYSPPTGLPKQRMLGLPREMWDIIDRIAHQSRLTGDDPSANHHSVIYCLLSMAVQILESTPEDEDVEYAVNPDSLVDATRVCNSQGHNPSDVVDAIAQEVAELEEQRRKDASRGKKSKKVYEEN